MELSKEKQKTLDALVSDLSRVKGVKALVLGGSNATGTATERSDLDIGIYYSEVDPFKIEDVRMIAEKYSVSENLTVTDFYGWGPWVNGGAWIETASGKVDFIYRNLEQVSSVIEKAKKGEWQNDFEQQPPYGFTSVIYLAETDVCLVLFDPEKDVAKLKEEVKVYPAALKETIVRQSLWSAEFAAWHADYFMEKNDIYSLMGCLTRGTKNFVNALFAINEIYPMGDKRALDILENARVKPSNLKIKIENIVCANKNTIGENIVLFKNLWSEIISLTNGAYQPCLYFKYH
jgi:predicted nucleotidyltransferase